MKSVIEIRVPNPLYRILFWVRMRRVVRKWNADMAIAEPFMKCLTAEDHFKWSQLVWQEIWMWVSLAEPERAPRELPEMAKRRGFNQAQIDYIEAMMRHVWLWKPCKTANVPKV